MKGWKLWILVGIVYSTIYSASYIYELKSLKSFQFSPLEYILIIGYQTFIIFVLTLPYIFYPQLKSRFIERGDLVLFKSDFVVFNLFTFTHLLSVGIIIGSLDVFTFNNILSICILNLFLVLINKKKNN